MDKHDSGETLCIYSLGNLVSAMQYWQNMVGGFFTFDIVVDEDGDIYADSPEFRPTAFYYGPSYYNSHLYFLSEYPPTSQRRTAPATSTAVRRLLTIEAFAETSWANISSMNEQSRILVKIIADIVVIIITMKAAAIV